MTFGRRTKSTAAPSVVAEVERQAAEAAALASIAGQERLLDPRLNPAVRAHADKLRDDQQRRALAAEHARLLRRLRVADQRAADAERTLEAVQLARQASSPARSVLALVQGKRRYLRLSLGASLVLAAGSARGVEAAAVALGARPGTGYVAEIGLTGLTTAVIAYRSHLSEHGGDPQGWQKRALYALMVVPLLVSVAANAFKAGPVGMFCALGAAAFAAFGYIVAEQSNAAMRARAAEVTATDEEQLRAIAMGDDLFSAPPSAEREGESSAAVQDPVAVEADRGVAEVEAWLADQDGPDGGVAAAAPPPDGSGPEGSHRGSAAGHIVADQRADRPERAGSHRAGSRVQAAAKARRAVGDATRSRVASYLADHPNASNGEIARELRVSEATVKRHRRELRQAAARQSGGER